MNPHDPRVRRTRQALARAMIDLTLDAGYSAVSIKHITEKAGIGYATFFRHYKTKDELLRDVMDVVMADTDAIFRMSDASENPVLATTRLFEYVRERAELYRVLLDSRGSAVLLREMVASSVDNVLRNNLARAESAIPPEVAAYHIVSASIMLIQWWLEHGMPYPPERMAYIQYELVGKPTALVAFADPPILDGIFAYRPGRTEKDGEPETSE